MFEADIASLFPDMCETVLNCSIIGRARKEGIVNLNVHNIRDYTTNKHKKVDDYPYGGGRGMLMQADPIYRCYEYVSSIKKNPVKVIYLSPKGKVFNQNKAIELSKTSSSLFLICGHYEGIDQRLIDEIVDEEISVGDFVLTGGELSALTILDAIIRLIPGVLSYEECYKLESHYDGLLEHPQYTRPRVWHGKSVPEILLSGHHENIKKWRYKKSFEITKERRPDMIK